MLKVSNLVFLYILHINDERRIFFLKNSLHTYLEETLIEKCKISFSDIIFNRTDLDEIKDFNEILHFIEKNKRKSRIRKNLYDLISKHNDVLILKDLEDAKDFLDEIESNPLTLCQRKAVINSNKYTLSLAGAGSGKTSVIVAKVVYLLNFIKVQPEEILLLAYNRDAARELRERIYKKTNEKISVHTFHALGRKLRVLKGDKYDESLSALENDDKLDRVMLGQLIQECMGDIFFRRSMETYVSLEYFLDDDTKIKDGKDLREQANLELRSITGVKVKSRGELCIANFLYFSGIKFKYEANLRNITNSEIIDFEINPDFYLPDYDVWIEHWGVDKNGRVSFEDDVNGTKYFNSMKKKKNLYKKLDLKLIETSYADFQDNILEQRLEEQLQNFEISLDSEKIHDPEAFLKFMDENPGPARKFMKGFEYFLRERPTEKEFSDLFVQSYGESIAKRLAYGVAKVFNIYKAKLKTNKSYTFSDMIHDGVKALDDDLILSWKYIIVDEYQDISKVRFNLLKKLVEKQKASLFCVGDDWQSINGFSGSDIKYILNFDKEFEHAERSDIEFTFRFRQDLADTAKKFVTQDPKLLNKNVLSSKNLDISYLNEVEKSSINIFYLTDQEAPYITFTDSLRNITNVESKDILFLARTNKALKKFKVKYSSLFNFAKSLKYKTIHSSKGLEADIVVLLELDNKSHGLPSGNGNTKFQKCFMSEPQELEERRLFYVALTRAKEKVYIPLINSSIESSFIKELESYEGINFIGDKKSNKYKAKDKVRKYMVCPACGKGKLVEKTNSYNGNKFLGCTMYRKNNCQFTQNIDDEAA